MSVIYLAGGCFWGTEKYISLINGVISTEVGYAHGKTENPTYDEVCSGSGHAEVVKVEYNKDIISLMLNNMSELREYYVINKRQANRVFNATLTACVMGGIIFIIGSIVAFWGGQKVSFYTTISGCVVELISGLFFWLYKRTIDQLNLYHERLGSTEKYLTAVQLVEKMSEQEKDSMYRYIIEMMLIDNSSKCRTKKPPENKVQNT